jgi:hypothetical protein
MLNKLNNLGFVIGAFFTIVAIILFVNILVSGRSDTLSLYSATAFLIFGVVMMVRN